MTSALIACLVLSVLTQDDRILKDFLALLRPA
jgi:hypothetical protein